MTTENCVQTEGEFLLERDLNRRIELALNMQDALRGHNS